MAYQAANFNYPNDPNILHVSARMDEQLLYLTIGNISVKLSVKVIVTFKPIDNVPCL